MGRTLTDEEKNKVKNLQVSNSIYRRQIKQKIDEARELQQKRESLRNSLSTLEGDELNAAELEITKMEGLIQEKLGKVAYIESRIAEKEAQIDEFKNKASREEEVVLATFDPNSKEFQDQFPVPEQPAVNPPKKSSSPKKGKKK